MASAVCLAVLTACAGAGSAFGAPPTARGAQAEELLRAEIEIVLLVNEYRVAHNLPRHQIDAALSRAARRHAETMGGQDRLSHVLAGVGPAERALAEGFTGPVAENIAAGIQGTPRVFFDLWVASKAHRENMLRPGAGVMGIGCALAGEGGKVYCAAMFGTSR